MVSGVCVCFTVCRLVLTYLVLGKLRILVKHCIVLVELLSSCQLHCTVRWPHVRLVTKRPSEYAGEWMDAGATWIGGCCAVRPQDISDIRSAIRQRLNAAQTRDDTESAK